MAPAAESPPASPVPTNNWEWRRRGPYAELCLFPHLHGALGQQAERGGGLRPAMLWLLGSPEGAELADCRVAPASDTGAALPCHRNILSARAPLLLERVGGAGAATGELLFEAPVERPQSLAMLLFWVYCGRLGRARVGPAELLELQCAAGELRLPGLAAEAAACAQQPGLPGGGEPPQDGPPALPARTEPDASCAPDVAYSRDFAALAETGDVEFTCQEGHVVRVVRELLLARSPWHRRLFSAHWAPPRREGGIWRVAAGELPAETLRDISRYLCSASRLSFLPSDAFRRVYQLAEAADLFSWEELRQDVSDWLRRHISDDTVCRLWAVSADLPGDVAARGACMRYFCDNFWEELRQDVSDWLRRHISDDTVCRLWAVSADLPGDVAARGACMRYFCDNFGSIAGHSDFLELRKPLLREALASGSIRGTTGEVFRAVRCWAEAQLRATGVQPAHDAVRDLIQDMLPPNTLFCQENTSELVGHPWQSGAANFL
eukprot:TRINITY_DN28412_c0_g2_i2.p1 TRINITY_DN28412_c0_g2~~TRINITY_DN28412_c0_g2_i2.p1  ORF type:complete len:493 (+),score=141.70 TRINITY_DN28412_c0_g2_i2:68-1546(+)